MEFLASSRSVDAMSAGLWAAPDPSSTRQGGSRKMPSTATGPDATLGGRTVKRLAVEGAPACPPSAQAPPDTADRNAPSLSWASPCNDQVPPGLGGRSSAGCGRTRRAIGRHHAPRLHQLES